MAIGVNQREVRDPDGRFPYKRQDEYRGHCGGFVTREPNPHCPASSAPQGHRIGTPLTSFTSRIEARLRDINVSLLKQLGRRSSFSAKSYAAFRPSYPPVLYRTILGYHQLPTPAGSALDLGCGHGLISRELSPHFASVTALDPSANMISQAQHMTPDNARITFRQGSAEDLDFLADKSVDMAVAGQAAHWFDYGRVWPNLARVVKSGGTLALFGYKDNVLMGFESATAVMERFIYEAGEVAPGVEGMGPYWEQPGRNILRDLLRSVVPPAADWANVQRRLHEPGQAGHGEDLAWQRKTMKLGEVEAYTRTFSCYHGWMEAHPDAKSRADGGVGDVVDVMWDHMRDVVPEWKATGEQWREIEVVSDWGTYILMARRR